MRNPLVYVIAAAVSVAALTSGCSSSGSRPSSCDATCQSNLSAANGSATPVDQYGNPVGSYADDPPSTLSAGLNDPDSASCADWAAAGVLDRQTAAIQYMTEFHDQSPIADLDPLVSAITTVCASYGDSETPRDAAKVSIQAVYGGG